jgi:hypothetical protein
MKPWQGLVLDALVVVCLTLLAALRVVPGEAVLAMLGTFVGARAMQRLNGGGPPTAGGAAAVSAVAALWFALFNRSALNAVR